MPDKPYKISVNVEVTIDDRKPHKDKANFGVEALFQSVVEIPADGIGVEVNIMPKELCQPCFIFVKPLTLGGKDFVIDDKLESKKLYEYSTTTSPKEQRKPIYGAHTFFNGMTEWVTDMTDGGTPGALSKLVFWNNGEKALSVLVIVGYSAIAPKPPAKKA